MAGTVVVALGGNAITRRHELGTVAEQLAHLQQLSRQLTALAQGGRPLVLVHGNGPQVGHLLLQGEEASRLVPPLPLYVCDAQTQGHLGFLIQMVLGPALAAAGVRRPVVTVVTQVVVDPGDPAFAAPSKPVGPFYSADRARALIITRRHVMREDAGRGWRRVVPSPEPRRVVELETIRTLVSAGVVTIAGGGGGIPVVEQGEGLAGVDAVIDKDLTAQLLAAELNADTLLLLTDVERVALHFGRPQQQDLDHVTLGEARRYLAAGHFAAGSMQTKMLAAVRHLEAGGRRAVIAHLDQAAAGLGGTAGTQVVPA